MDTSQQTQSQTTQSTQSTQSIDIDWMFQDRDPEDFDLIEFGIASNGGLSITQHK